MKYFFYFIALFILSCANKEDVFLPKASISIVKNVEDLSTIYIFFKTNAKDTLAEVNRKNSIISTNWVFNIDKRLPLKLVIPEVMKLQEKKRADSTHKNEKAENYYSYADTINKNLAFLPFTHVYYKTTKPIKGFTFYFKKENDLVLLNNTKVKKSDVIKYFNTIDFAVNPEIILLFDKNMSYEEYIQNKILIRELDNFNNKIPTEFIF